MEIIKIVLAVVQLLAALSVIVLVLLQHGKGADSGAAFGGGGSSSSVFGASGSANFLSRSTAIMASIFLVSTALLAFKFGGIQSNGSSVLPVNATQELIEKKAVDQIPKAEVPVTQDSTATPKSEQAAEPKK